MTKQTFSAVGSFFSVLGSAVAASRAIEGGKAPRARDLRVLGIDPAQFKTIRQL